MQRTPEKHQYWRAAMAFPGTSSAALQISVVSVQKFNLSHTEFIRIINHLSASCTRNSYVICKKKKKKRN